MQAAVGGAALDLIREESKGPEAEQRGRLVLTLSVLVILLTAPLGALGIAIFGPLWLSHDEPPIKSVAAASSERSAAGGPALAAAAAEEPEGGGKAAAGEGGARC